MNDIFGASLNEAFYEKTHHHKGKTDADKFYLSSYYNVRNVLMHNLGTTFVNRVSHDLTVTMDVPTFDESIKEYIRTLFKIKK